MAPDQRTAIKWSYALRNRERWAGRADLLERHRQEVDKLAAECGFTDAILQAIAAVDLVELSIPFVSEERGWNERIVPWEYIITTAIRNYRDAVSGGVTVVRHLRHIGGAP
jgi:hypothetical protein